MRLTVIGFLMGCLMAIAACDALAPPAPTATSPDPTGAPIPVATSTSPAPTPEATEVPVPSPTLPPIIPTSTPVPLTVGKTGGDGIWIRATPAIGNKLKAWPDGTRMVVIGPDQTVGGQIWRNVRDPAGNVGWVAGEYLLTAAEVAPAGPTKTPNAVPAGVAPPIVTPTP
jgi:hypothetical protein